MKSFDTEIAKYAEKTRLKAAERAELRDRILTYMEYHPLPKNLQAEKNERDLGKRAWAASVYAFEYIQELSTHTYARATAGVFMFLLIIGTIPFIAERSVPGDVLYPVKTNVNETFLGQFANSPYEKVSFETELMERRIAEARLLAKEGKLTNDVEEAIAADVKEHADAAQKGITELKESDADEAAIAEIAFGTALEVQTAVLKGTESSTTPAKGIANAVREAKATADATKSADTPSYEKLSTRVRTEMAKAYALFASIKSDVSDEERSDIERRLGDIERKITEAQNIHASEISGDGAPELAETLSDVRKVISFLTDIDVREHVDIESLVPIVLTHEERITAATHTIEDAGTRFEGYKQRVASSTDKTLTVSVSEGSTQLDSLLMRASTSRSIGDVTELENIAKDAAALIEKIGKLFGDVPAAGGPTSENTETNTTRSTSTAAVLEERSEV